MIITLSLHKECGKGNLERLHFSRSIRDKSVTKTEIYFVTAPLLAQNCKLCLEMLYLFTKSSSWSQYVPSLLLLYTFHWLCSLPNGFYGLTNDKVYDVYLILREARLWMNAWGAPSGLRLRQGALPNCWVEKCSLCPEGIQATTGLLCSFRQWVALLEGVADCEWLLEPLRDQSWWLSDSCCNCVCEKNECPDTSLRPGSLATWAMILFRTTKSFVENIVNKHRLGQDIHPEQIKSSFTWGL